MTPTPPPEDRFGAADEVLREAAEAEDAAPQPAARPGWLGRLVSNRDVAILLVAVILFALFALAGPRFLTENNLIDLARRAAILGILAVGMTYLFVAGELDLVARGRSRLHAGQHPGRAGHPVRAQGRRRDA